MPETPPIVGQQKIAGAASPENYAFVVNVRSLGGAASHVLAPGHELRRATPIEVAVIKDQLASMGALMGFKYMYLWEMESSGRGGIATVLPQSEWRYFVIAFRGSNATIGDLEGTFDLAPSEVEIGFTIINDFGGRGVVWSPGRFFAVLDSAPRNDAFFLDLVASDVDEIRIVYSQLQAHNPQIIDTGRLAFQLSQLKALPHHSPLRFLGYFAVLESLLTHAPKPSDPYDSITRQVKMKLALLDARFPRKLDYASFGAANVDSIWSKMYHYRSQVAHGGAPHFAGDLAVLKSHETALALIRNTVKAVIRQAISEPQLLRDLREC